MACYSNPSISCFCCYRYSQRKRRGWGATFLLSLPRRWVTRLRSPSPACAPDGPTSLGSLPAAPSSNAPSSHGPLPLPPLPRRPAGPAHSRGLSPRCQPEPRGGRGAASFSARIAVNGGGRAERHGAAAALPGGRTAAARTHQLPNCGAFPPPQRLLPTGRCPSPTLQQARRWLAQAPSGRGWCRGACWELRRGCCGGGACRAEAGPAAAAAHPPATPGHPVSARALCPGPPRGREGGRWRGKAWCACGWVLNGTGLAPGSRLGAVSPSQPGTCSRNTRGVS